MLSNLPSRLPGGCDDCNAYQTVTLDDGIYRICIHHDDTCPFYRKRTARRDN